MIGKITGDILINLRPNSTGIEDHSTIGNEWDCKVPVVAGGKFSQYALNSSHDINQYLKLSKTNDLTKFNIPKSPTFTLSMWIYVSKIDDINCLFNIYPSANENISISTAVGLGNNSYVVYNDNSYTSSTYYIVSTPISLNSWIHFCCIADKGKFSMFYNGIKCTESKSQLATTVQVTPINYTDIGLLTENNTTSSRPRNFIGLADDIVFIKDQALWTSNFKVPSTYLCEGGYIPNDINDKKLKQY
jgi:hypothetical protein